MKSLLSTLHKFECNAVENPKRLLTLCAAVFFGWILIIPFDGLIVRELMIQGGLHNPAISLMLMGVHFLGLITSAFMAKNLRDAWLAMTAAVGVCLLASLFLFLPISAAGYLSLFIMAYFSGIFVAAWGQPLQAMVPSSQRFTVVVDVLIIANLLMIFSDMITILVHVLLGKIFALLFLFMVIGSLWILKSAFISAELIEKSRGSHREISRKSTQLSLVRPFAWLCLFIILITLNSGIMYQVVTPTFSQLPLLTSFYWAIPYITALVVLRTMPQKANRSNTLYLALAMMGLGYLGFELLPVNAGSFIVIYALMLGALGIFDLFWWSLMASFLDYSKRPSMVLGVGLAANVLGIFLGGFIGNIIYGASVSKSEISLAAFGFIFVGLALLPVVNRELTQVFQHHIFLVHSLQVSETKTVTNPLNDDLHMSASPDNMLSGESDPLIDIREQYQITDREEEIIAFIRKGYTYRAIAEVLGITEHTIKFHTKNIYQKMGIKNKMELVQKMATKQEK